MGKLLYLAALAMITTVIFSPTASARHSYTCGYFQYQEDAQAVYDRDTSDPNGLDILPGKAYAGTQGVACEDLPHRGGTYNWCWDPYYGLYYC